MPEPRAQRTLVKSPPEIWAEVSDVSTLARHLGEFGEIRITRLEAETTVVWEGDRARGTVELEASGWGTKVTITAEALATDDAEVVEAEVVAEEVMAEVVVEEEEAPVEVEQVAEVAIDAEVEPEPEPEAVAPEAVVPTLRRGILARLRLRRRTAEAVAEPLAIEPPAAVSILDPDPVGVEPEIIPTVADPEPVAEIADAIDVSEAPEISEPVLDGEITAGAAAATAAFDPEQVEAVLVGVLDDLGSAHHRPFSRG
jgi:hypothetical protein